MLVFKVHHQSGVAEKPKGSSDFPGFSTSFYTIFLHRGASGLPRLLRDSWRNGPNLPDILRFYPSPVFLCLYRVGKVQAAALNPIVSSATIVQLSAMSVRIVYFLASLLSIYLLLAYLVYCLAIYPNLIPALKSLPANKSVNQ